MNKELNDIIAARIGRLEVDLIGANWTATALHAEMKRLQGVVVDRDKEVLALKLEVADLREALHTATAQASLDLRHSSDCAMNNAPALEPKPCDCGSDLPRAHSNNGMH